MNHKPDSAWLLDAFSVGFACYLLTYGVVALVAGEDRMRLATFNAVDELSLLLNIHTAFIVGIGFLLCGILVFVRQTRHVGLCASAATLLFITAGLVEDSIEHDAATWGMPLTYGFLSILAAWLFVMGRYVD